ncbi:hypothetical protein ACJRO7_018069 [Eucalyptus globulus]|uniref:Uncharacterized protein n=1 Tax=Eucalyptus globulus TaxID=34317 RepID=A0ABD3KWP6_EUCGL
MKQRTNVGPGGVDTERWSSVGVELLGGSWASGSQQHSVVLTGKAASKGRRGDAQTGEAEEISCGVFNRGLAGSSIVAGCGRVERRRCGHGSKLTIRRWELARFIAGRWSQLWGKESLWLTK